MTKPSNTAQQQTPKRGELWWVDFSPTKGDEIRKTRPAVVMNISSHWNLKLYIVVPVTQWQARFQRNNYFWMVKLPIDSHNQLQKDSAANTFQVKSVAAQRFKNRMGILNPSQTQLIAATIAFCVGYQPPRAKPSSST